MKKIRYILALILLIFVTGCSDYNMSMKIDNDKTMEYTVSILSDYYNKDLVVSVSVYKQRFEQYGYSVEEYNQNNQYGIIISKRFDNIDDISYGERIDEFNLLYLYTDGYSADVENKMFNLDKGIGTNRYAANFYVDLSGLGINLNNASVTYRVELPNGSLSNNATSVSEDGKILTWNISSLGKTEIDFVFELNSYDSIYYGVAILIAIFLFFSVINGLFRKKDDDDDDRRVYTNSRSVDVDRRITNLTTNAIKNNSNKNVGINSVNNSKNNSNLNSGNVNKSAVSSSGGENFPKVDVIQSEDDITNLKTSVSKKKGILSAFSGKKAQTVSNGSTVVNNNDEVDKMIENVNDSNVNFSNNVDNSNFKANVNMSNGGGSILDWYEPSSNNIISNTPVNSSDPIINVKPIVASNSDVNTNVSIINNDVDTGDKLTQPDSVSVQSNTTESFNNNDISNDGPVIRVNSKSVSVNNEKRD